MGYYLTFAFDKECKNSIILMEGTLEEIDKFTSQFKSSVDVRKKFKKEIDQFYTEKSEYIKKVEEKTNRKETGDIAIYSIVGKVHETAMNKRTKVLYKFYIDIFTFTFDHLKASNEFHDLMCAVLIIQYLKLEYSF